MQSGAFLLFGMSVAKMDPNKVRVMDQSNYIQFCELDSSCEKMICPSIKKIRIPHQHKQRILEELDLLGINEGFLFPELEYQSKKGKRQSSRRLVHTLKPCENTPKI